MNTVDFFNELTVFYEICEDYISKQKEKYSVGQGYVIAIFIVWINGKYDLLGSFPPGFEYRWRDGVGIKHPIKCSAPEYVDYVLTWVEGQMNNEAIFPTSGIFEIFQNYLVMVNHIL